MDYSKLNDRDCADCQHSDHWPRYQPEKTRVCRHPAVLKITGGPRSCQDLVRAPGGHCGPDGKFHVERNTPTQRSK